MTHLRETAIGAVSALAVVAQAPVLTDQAVSWPAIVGSLGSASAAVIVVMILVGAFRQYATSQAASQKEQFDQITDRQEASRKDFLAQVNEFQSQVRDFQAQTREFQVQIQRLVESHAVLTRDAIVATKSLEKAVDASTDTIRSVENMIRSVERRVDSLGLAVEAIIQRRQLPPPAQTDGA